MAHFIDEDGHVYGGLDVPAAGDVFPYMLRHGCTMLICLKVRRRVFADVGSFKPERFEIASDTEMWLRLMRRYLVGIMNERLVRYRHGPRLVSTNFSGLSGSAPLGIGLLHPAQVSRQAILSEFTMRVPHRKPHMVDAPITGPGVTV